jgi:ankyrin repeat protein
MIIYRKLFYLVVVALISGFYQQPRAVAGVYEDLRWAIEDNNTADVGKLLARGADPNTSDERGNTLLMVAVGHKNADLVDLLVNAGAKLNLRNNRGETAIMLASYQGFKDIVEKLYLKGAEINHAGWNPLIYAASGGHTDIIRYCWRGCQSTRWP